jgi:predicted  nucleic acid-binding Zn-ribbon protein
MSSYPPPKNSGLGIYNSGSFLGLDDVGGATKLVLDLANYVRSDAGTFSGNIQTNGSLVLGNTIQNLAFSDDKNTMLVNVDQRTSDISYASNQTTVSGDFAVTGAVIIPDNSLSISKISTLQTKLDQIDANLAQNVQDGLDISGLQTFQASQQTINTSTTNSLSTINTTLTAHDDEFGTINGVLTAHNSHLSTLDSTTASHTSSIAAIESTLSDQETTNTSTATALGLLQAKDTSLDSDIADIGSSITALQTKDSQLDTEIAAINSDITSLEAADVTLQTNITANDNSITSINGSIASINSTILAHSEMLNSLEILTDLHTTSISNLDTSSAAHETQIGDLETLTTSHTSSISSISTQQDLNTSAIATKQPILNSSNRLDAAYIGDGSISNASFQTLYGINTGSSIESRLTALSNTLNGLDIDVDTLETLQNIDLSTFNTIGAQLTTIEGNVATHATDISNLQTDVATNATDISNLQTNVASNTGRLNVNDANITTIQTNVSTNAANIATNTSDIGTLQSNMSTNTADILTKQNIINSGNKLAASLVSTNVDTTPSTLDVILQSLTDVNSTQSSTISSINDSITTLTNDIATNETAISGLLTADTTHSNLIATNSADIATNTAAIATKQDIISGSNLLSSAYLFDTAEDDTMDNIIVRIDGDIATKQSILNATTNQLPIDYVDLSTSNLQYADYGSSINSKFSSLDGQISTLTTLQNGDVANFVAIDDNFTEIDAHLLTLDGQVANYIYLANVTGDIQDQIDNVVASSLPSMSYHSGSMTTTIANITNITTLTFSGDGSQQTTAFTSALKTDVEANTASVATLISDVSANTSAIATKQSILNGTDNKLPIDYVDISASNIRFADFGSSIATKFTNIDSTLSSQSTTNSSVSTSLSNLSSGKQDVLSSGNKLNPSFITTSGGGDMTSTKFQYLTSIDADIATKFTGKADVNGPTFTGVVTIPSLAMTGPFVCKGIAEQIASTFTSFTSNILTADFTNNSLLYFNGLTANTNFKLALTSVPTTAYQTQTFSLIIGVGSYKAFANTCSINGTDYTLVANGGLASVDLTGLTTSGCLLQQFTIIYLNSSVFKVITNVSSFY